MNTDGYLNLCYTFGVLVYFAGPLFSEAEKRFNLKLTKKLENLGFKVFLPQRDGVERDKPPYDTMEPDARRKALFELDTKMIFDCDTFLIILDGRVPDEGACLELGVAYTQKRLEKNSKRIVGLMTDARAAFLGGKLNPMIKVPIEFIAGNEKELLSYLENVK